MASETQGVGRAATVADLPLVAACLASAFYEDPLWGHWTFPDESRRRRHLLPFMTLMAEPLCRPKVWSEEGGGVGADGKYQLDYQLVRGVNALQIRVPVMRHGTYLRSLSRFSSRFAPADVTPLA